MKRSIMALAAMLLAASATLTACGGGTPSKDDLSESLQDSGGLDEETSDCLADALLDADLSDDQLNAIADDDRSDLSSDEVEEVTQVITDATADCLG